MTAPGRALVLLAHGSPDRRHAEGVEHLAALVRRLAPGRPVHTAYLDHHRPDPGAAARSAPHGAVVVPVLLTPAYHARVDVPDAVARMRAVTGADYRATTSLGPDPLLVRASRELVAGSESPRPGSAVILYAAGSSDSAAVATIRETVEAGGPVPGWGPWVVAALDGGADLREVVERLRATAGVRRVVVAAFTVAEGVLRDRMAGNAREVGLELVPGALSHTRALAELVLRRADSLPG